MGPLAIRSPRSRALRIATGVALVSLSLATTMSSAPVATGAVSSYAATIGTPSPLEPSGMAPPAPTALAGYAQSYVSDFNGTSLPGGWGAYGGQPGNDPGTTWQSSQVVVSNGLLQLNAAYDTSRKEWITGGTSGGPTALYGAFFVRSRMTAPGPTIDELLWPSSSAWPPEIDFDETYGPTNQSMATVHFTAANLVDHRTIHVDMTQWHTWGVVWTPTSITYTLDGAVWGTVNVAGEIPSIPMHLAIQQQTWCAQGFACPSAPSSDLVDWVAEYEPSTASSPGAVAPAPGDTSQRITIDTMSPLWRLRSLVRHAADRIVRSNATTVTLDVTSAHLMTGGPLSAGQKVSQVIAMLRQDIRSHRAADIRVVVHWARAAPVRGHLVVHIFFH